jgi:alpha-D-xyloside xylohydrolase
MKHLSIYLLFFLAAGIIAACSTDVVRETPNGVEVTLTGPAENGPMLVRLQVINDRIIRVSALPEKAFPGRKSLIVVDQGDSVPEFTVTREDDRVILKTKSVTATLSAKDGAISFADEEGHTLLAEIQGGGKTFHPITVESREGYSFRQVFDSIRRRFSDLASTRVMSGTTRAGTRFFTSIIRRFPFPLWYPAGITGSSGTIIP